MRKSKRSWVWLVSGLTVSAFLTACGGGGSSSGSSGSASTSSVVPSAWVGAWKSVNWVRSDGTCYASYQKASSAGGGTYYGNEFNATLTISSNGVATNVASLYNDDNCTSLAGTVTTTFQISSLQAQVLSAYTDVATFVAVTTASSISASGGTGLYLASVPTGTGTTNARGGLNASGELCFGGGLADSSGYPSFAGAVPPDICHVKQ